MTQSNKMGFKSLLSLIIGVMIGAGILMLPASMAHYGVYSLYAWIIAGLSALNLAFIFSYLIKNNPDCKDPASFANKYIGERAGFMISWWHWIGMTIGTALIAITLSSYLISLLGISTFYTFPIALAFTWLVLLLQSKYAFASIGLLIGLSVIKVAILLLISLSGIAKLNWTALSTVHNTYSGSFSMLLSSLALAMFAFIGIESATLPGQDVENKDKIVPLATFTGAVIATIIYVLTYSVVVSVVPYNELITSSTPLGNAALRLIGPMGSKLVAGLAVICCLGSLHGCLMCSAFLLKNSTVASFMPQSLSQTNNSEYPVKAGFITACAVSILLAVHYLSPISMQMQIRETLTYVEVFLVALVYGFSVIIHGITGGKKLYTLIGFLSCGTIIYGSRVNNTIVTYQFGAILVGLLLYLILMTLYYRKHYQHHQHK